MTPEEDDLFGPKPTRRDHAAQADGAIADDGRRLARPDIRADGRMVTGCHHVRECQQPWHQRVVLANRQDDARAVCLGNAHRFALAAVNAVRAIPSTMEAGAVQPFPTEDAGAIGVEERRGDDIAGVHGSDIGANGLDDTDELVSHPAAGVAGRHRLVRPKIAPADGGAGDDDKGIGWFDERGVGNGLDANVASAEHDGCFHSGLPLGCEGLSIIERE